MRFFLLGILALFSQIGFATTWSESKVQDPIEADSQCEVSKPASYGSYIYNWPSKYDQVFWPYTEWNNVWFCKKSGYISFMSDFSDLNEVEIGKIRSYLKQNKIKEPSEQQLIFSLEAIYSLRELTPEYKNRLDRIFARWHQRLGNLERAATYRKKAYADIEKSLLFELTDYKRLEYFYLAANYAKYFDERQKSEEYLLKLKTEINRISGTELKGYGRYLTELAEHIQYIEPGGVLDPSLPDTN